MKKEDTYGPVQGDIEIVRGNTRLILYVQGRRNKKVLARLDLTEFMRTCGQVGLDPAAAIIDGAAVAFVKHKLTRQTT
jgi:hypothetical protein